MVAGTLVAAGIVLALGCSKDEEKKKDAAEAKATSSAASATPGAPADTPAASAPRPAAGTRAYLPKNCHLAAHLDLKELKKHPKLQAALEKGPVGASSPGFVRLKQAFKKANVDFNRDVEEISICILDMKPRAKGKFEPLVVYVGGKLPPGKVLDALAAVPNSGDKVTESNGLKVLSRTDGMSLAQLGDGTVVLSGNAEQIPSVSKASDAHKAYGFSPDAALSLVVTDKGLAAVDLPKLAGSRAEFKQLPLDKLTSLQVAFKSLPVQLTGQLAMDSAESAKKAAKDFTALTAVIKKELEDPQAKALGALEFAAKDSTVTFDLTLDEATANSLLDGMGQAISERHAKDAAQREARKVTGAKAP
jgi:hypothetical protein